MVVISILTMVYKPTYNWAPPSRPGYHLSCTCAMGKVVDAEGRVKGEGTNLGSGETFGDVTGEK